MKIEKISGREIYDAQGCPTIECELTLEDGSFVTGSVPAGISKSKFEAFEMRDESERMMGKGVLEAIDSLESKIAPLLIGQCQRYAGSQYCGAARSCNGGGYGTV